MFEIKFITLAIIQVMVLLIIIGIIIYMLNKPFESFITNDKEFNSLNKMKECYELHLKRLDRLKNTINELTNIKYNLNKELNCLNSKVNYNKFKALELQKQNRTIDNIASELSTDDKLLNDLKMELKEVSEREKFLMNYEKGYSNIIKDIKYTIDTTEKQYERKKKLAKTYSEADEFISGFDKNNLEYQLALEESEKSISLFTSKIIDIENRSKLSIDKINFENKFKELKGFDIINEYSNKLKQIN